MNTVTVKIVNFESPNGFLICRFASDTTASSNPDDYPALTYQPAITWPDANTEAEIMECVARAGQNVCEEIVKIEAMKNNDGKMTILAEMVGNTQTFNVSDITTSTDETDSEEV